MCRQYLPAVLAPKASVSTQTDAEELPATQQMLENLQLVREPENEQQQQQQQQQPELSADPPQQALGYKYRSNPFAVSAMYEFGLHMPCLGQWQVC